MIHQNARRILTVTFSDSTIVAEPEVLVPCVEFLPCSEAAGFPFRVLRLGGSTIGHLGLSQVCDESAKEKNHAGFN
jgi:hypothetical protein